MLAGTFSATKAGDLVDFKPQQPPSPSLSSQGTVDLTYKAPKCRIEMRSEGFLLRHLVQASSKDLKKGDRSCEDL